MSEVVISYIPALHQGYINFFDKHRGKLFVLGKQFISEYPRMDRDIRALEPAQVAEMVKSLGLMDDVQVLDSMDQLKGAKVITLPDDDLNRQFAKAHLEGSKVTLVPAFLRWDHTYSTTEQDLKPDRKITASQLDRELMSLAEAEAPKSPDWWRQIGAVLAKGGKPILVGYNHPIQAADYTFGTFGDPRSNFDAGQGIELSKVLHGEAGLIAEAARRGIATEGASIYVTTFPCPVCAKSIAAAGIKKVYYQTGYSLLDAEDVLSAHGVELILVK